MKKQKFIASYEEACAKLGVSTDLPDVSTFDEDMHKHLIALHKLRRITKVNGGSYVPDLGNTGQRKYHPLFKIPEMLRIQGFPDGYKLVGTQTEQKKYIGNSVTPVIPQEWGTCLAEALSEIEVAA